MQRVAVLGVGSTRYGNHCDVASRTLGAQAVAAALNDAGLQGKHIDNAYVGYGVTGLLDGQEGMIGQLALRELGITGIPITRVENACSSSACALREAYLAIRAGESRISLAFGVEKMLGHSTQKIMTALAGDGDVDLEGSCGLTFPATFAMLARAHMEQYGTPREAFAAVTEKAHAFAAHNEYAHFRTPVTREQVLQSRPVASPLTVFDCCPASDGAAAVILASEEVAMQHSGPKVWISACVLLTGNYEGRDLTSFDATRRAAALAYERAGAGPEHIDLAEVHDCFTIAEIIHTEDLGFFPKGDGGHAVLRGDTRLGGKVTINASGGLKAKGHPVGATGAGQIVEATKQLRGECGRRQVDGAKVALTHCMGGFFAADSGSIVVTILQR